MQNFKIKKWMLFASKVLKDVKQVIIISKISTKYYVNTISTQK